MLSFSPPVRCRAISYLALAPLRMSHVSRARNRHSCSVAAQLAADKVLWVQTTQKVRLSKLDLVTDDTRSCSTGLRSGLYSIKLLA